ncbi:hypothetical protein PAPYR_391 [Paratrimastix pyriformis]|uniref:Uncharacterized protein n=1 Tax=Paratrimastix pyriformis TaxID=342808 RepID=A0ABQ8UX23_9EUKA|nr:hypothetical protein PAPYR_391 [Paratrimastix pyriformis]
MVGEFLSLLEQPFATQDTEKEEFQDLEVASIPKFVEETACRINLEYQEALNEFRDESQKLMQMTEERISRLIQMKSEALEIQTAETIDLVVSNSRRTHEFASLSADLQTAAVNAEES